MNAVIIDKGRNGTIVKSQTENNPPRTVANTKFTDEEVRGGNQLMETQKCKSVNLKHTGRAC